MVPEPYLKPFTEAAESERQHSAGKCTKPAPPPEFWMKCNAINVKAKEMLLSSLGELEVRDA